MSNSTSIPGAGHSIRPRQEARLQGSAAGNSLPSAAFEVSPNQEAWANPLFPRQGLIIPAADAPPQPPHQNFDKPDPSVLHR
ncbi:hypothetical protein SAMN04488069_110116 [Hymenobacter psychrophilus]|uniref:Uncharacterized protein n=1 Tax=Hymenobacter psychrophilus TaxID=651662 RepID=A0A1H3L626_9BACT|nr:hypothetical protein SAMN04488069_110116 [Hymenobacter psychrophilus]